MIDWENASYCISIFGKHADDDVVKSLPGYKSHQRSESFPRTSVDVELDSWKNQIAAYEWLRDNGYRGHTQMFNPGSGAE